MLIACLNDITSIEALLARAAAQATWLGLHIAPEAPDGAIQNIAICLDGNGALKCGLWAVNHFFHLNWG